MTAEGTLVYHFLGTPPIPNPHIPVQLASPKLCDQLRDQKRQDAFAVGKKRVCQRTFFYKLCQQLVAPPRHKEESIHHNDGDGEGDLVLIITLVF